MVQKAGLENSFFCDSAGTIGYHAGSAPDSRMSKTIRNRGYEVSGAARQFDPSDFQDFDLILTMDEENYAHIIKLAKTADERAKVKRFTDFCTRHEKGEVPDPYYGGNEAFE